MMPTETTCGRPARMAAALLLVGLALLQASCHQVHEARARKLTRTAIESFQAQDYERALEHSALALKLGSEDPNLRRVRAAVFLMQRDPETALEEADSGIVQIAAINGDPHHPMGTVPDADRSSFEYLRGSALQAMGELEKSRDAFTESATLDPDNAGSQNNLAWLLATSPLKSVRDGKLAIQHGKIACDLTNWQNSGTLDTLAAAYAEAGDFDNAVKWQATAIEIFAAGSSQVPEDEVADFQGRLDLYREEKPYREDPVETFQAPPLPESSASPES